MCQARLPLRPALEQMDLRCDQAVLSLTPSIRGMFSNPCILQVSMTCRSRWDNLSQLGSRLRKRASTTLLPVMWHETTATSMRCQPLSHCLLAMKLLPWSLSANDFRMRFGQALQPGMVSCGPGSGCRKSRRPSASSTTYKSSCPDFHFTHPTTSPT